MSAVTQANLVVLGPETIVKQFPNEKHMISANYANFGHIPYGQSIIGQVYVDGDNMNGCKKMSLDKIKSASAPKEI